ncbi:hypothetical protein AIGOOFII_2584 [Methylobacterium marchantiae]|nr:hypothetical protein AIGOOFII_2584 [Methylobacterium marchantiae]
MPISSFARLGASSLTLALGLLLAGPSPILAGPKPAQSAAASKAVDSSRTRSAKKTRSVKAKPAPAATGSLAKEAGSTNTSSTDAPGVTWTSAEPDELRCGRSRRKLWQPGEGWVVKNVTVCR